MPAVINALVLAMRQLSDPPVLRVLAKSIAITIGLFVLLGFGISEGLPRLMSGYLDLGGETYAILSLILTLFALWFLFRIVAVAVLQFFADEVVIAVEARHYPAASLGARRLPFREDLSNSLGSIARTIGINLLAIPIALLLIPTGIGPAIAFFGANAILLGRELTDMAWLRHRQDPGARSPAGRVDRLILGAAVAGLMLVPFVNLLAPVLGAAAGTHLVHRRLRNDNA
ncbi:EI24 domain-containing protein [Altererythrobacter arenosus]|uniref:EI24 domain-containing protein n=1 Tax=Altererythrobacter arenosus TaxID=3032592 RepID=A0ABY8FUA3_9SPHN|nr:EI24 domain-containing protein [Altererythrobacter sp. CAU 1644]WFL78599.1 EI24 domain-containing protein [Altererythrobacter sp. CAU 1644]